MRRIVVITVGRSDFGIYLPVLEALRADSALELVLLASGSHLSMAHGYTVKEIVRSGFPVDEQIDTMLASDTPAAIAKSMGLAVMGFADAYERRRPDLVLLLGDRFEMAAAALAAVPLQIPLAHIHGGEITAGAIDEAFRHSITKCSHVHFASTREHADRIVQLGEAPWRVSASGAPSLDNLSRFPLLSDCELAELLGTSLEPAPIVVTFHPVTTQFDQAEYQVGELIAALEATGLPVIATKPNADTKNHVVIEQFDKFARRNGKVTLVDNLGTRGYFSLMKRARAMVGNSSSGIIEAASFELPVVNVGIRQAGRPRSRNVIDVGNSREEINAGIAQAISTQFRKSLTGMTNAYGDGRAAKRIVDRLKSIPLDSRLLIKRFHDIPVATQDPARRAA